jgi:pyruvate/2-oxoglutarate dehydrogenase complex dihydrolipoamide acyltransferase (E2) component
MPNVRLRAKELGVDLAELSRVTGKTGIISKRDVEDFATTQSRLDIQKPKTSPRARSLQSAMAKRMSESWLVPQFTQDVEIEIEALKMRKERLAAEGLKVSFASSFSMHSPRH